MAAVDVSTLDQIFRMLTPIDVLGNQKISLGKTPNLGGDPISELKRMLHGIGACGAMSADDMKSSFNKQLTKVADSDEALKLFRRVFRMYSSTGPLGENAGKAQYKYKDAAGRLLDNVTFD